MRLADQLTDEEEQQLQEAEQIEGTEARERTEEDEFATELPRAVERYGEVVTAVHALLDRRAIDLEALTTLSAPEREALAILPEIVAGRRGQRSLLAEVRLRDLNQVLAALQPALAVATMNGADRLNDSFEEVRTQINELRARLTVQEEAEEDRLLHEEMRRNKKPDDDGDGDDDDGGDADADAETDADEEAAPEAAGDEPAEDPEAGG